MSKDKKETLYTTQEWKGYGKQNYYHNEYRQDGDTIEKVQCHRQKFFDGKENNWDKSEKVVESWTKGDPGIPDWLEEYIND